MLTIRGLRAPVLITAARPYSTQKRAGSPWTIAADDELIRLWGEGVSASEIGAALDVSKNAVVGRVHRLGLPKRKQTSHGTLLQPQDRAVLRAIERAANAEAQCPTNRTLCELIGSASESTPVNALRRLREAGFIEVERYGTTRVVTIVATGRRTAGDVHCGFARAANG